MTMPRTFATRAFALAAVPGFVLSTWSTAAAETVNCTTIAALPAVITTQGVHCLKGDLATPMPSGHAIEINTNNVTIDLNGFKLGGLAAGIGTNTFGIYAKDRQNIAIRNGTIRGFRQAIVIETTGASQGHLIEDIRADQNTEAGIQVNGSGSIVRNNRIVDTGGTTALGTTVPAYGIYVSGDGMRVIDNDIADVHGTGGSVGFAILFASGNNALAVNNRMTGVSYGIVFGSGTGKYRDNLTMGVVFSPYDGGTDAGNNQ